MGRVTHHLADIGPTTWDSRCTLAPNIWLASWRSFHPPSDTRIYDRPTWRDTNPRCRTRWLYRTTCWSDWRNPRLNAHTHIIIHTLVMWVYLHTYTVTVLHKIGTPFFLSITCPNVGQFKWELYHCVHLTGRKRSRNNCGPVALCTLVVLERCGLLKERSILIDFRGKHRGFDFDFFWLPKYEPYAGLTEKVLTVAFSPVHTCDYRRFRRL